MQILEYMYGCKIKHIEISVNTYILESLHMKNIHCPALKEGIKIKIPFEKGFMESHTRNTSLILHSIGAHSYNHAAFNRPDIQIGRYCSIANLRFMRDSHPLNLITSSPVIYEETMFCQPAKTIIENDVWIADNAMIKPGVKLHTGCVIGANSLVTKDVPPYAIVGGVSAKILKYRFDKNTIKRLLALQWWKYNAYEFKKIPWGLEINAYLDKLEEQIQNHQIKPFKPQKLYFEELLEMAKTYKSITIPNQPLGASSRLKSHLSYKLGVALIDNSKSLLGYIRMPYVLSYIKDKHYKEQKEYQEKIKKNPKLKLPPLESYFDYKESLKIKTSLSYKLGEALIKANSAGGGGQIEYLLTLPFFKKCVG
ncbi:CatB-related O-acetyltransferase [Helicobacter turcicus]|uniref:CatB-related O-acetyltransferase n=1 Tax=Helicobacter turcicus TaxID=2867412 RepID=UPI001C87EB50|nr:CatB-related O-acetyltransferase [Helicobacter turcicus]MBX7546379.1 CatB-related O-acetyltransferase [Helicobacter turcicus]